MDEENGSHDDSSHSDSMALISDEVNHSKSVVGNEAMSESRKQRKPRKSPAVAWKKPKGMPKRPLSAYNLFFKEERQAIMSARAKTIKKDGSAVKRSKKETVGIGFANLAKTIGEKWQIMDASDKAPYLDIAAKEKKRYNEEMKIWREKQKEEKHKKANLLQLAGGNSLQIPETYGYKDSRIHPTLHRHTALSNNVFHAGLRQRHQVEHQQPYIQLMAQPHHIYSSHPSGYFSLPSNAKAGGENTSIPATPIPQHQYNRAAFPESWFELPLSQGQPMDLSRTALHPPSLGNVLGGGVSGDLRKMSPNTSLDNILSRQLRDRPHFETKATIMKHHPLLGPSSQGVVMKKRASDAGVATISSSLHSLNSGRRYSVPVVESCNTVQHFSLSNLASKLDNDTISFLTEFQFGNGSPTSSGGGEESNM